MKIEKIEKQAEKIMSKIKKLTDEKNVSTTFEISDNSVQSELRLSASWSISVPIDHIKYPGSIGQRPHDIDLWSDMSAIHAKLNNISRIVDRVEHHTDPISSKTKTGPQRRAESRAGFIVTVGTLFLSDYKNATKKSELAKIRRQISDLQSEQKALIPRLREINSKYLSDKRAARDDRRRTNEEAIKSGEFWRADRDALKSYFHPPFDKNYVSDVSKKWRACLILECKSVSFKRYSGNWGHKLAGTGRGYLCGIDDNGDEWGFVVRDLPQQYDDYGDAKFDNTVEDAMARVFGIMPALLRKCYRQGDLLVCPVKIISEPKIVCECCGQEWEGYECEFCGYRYSKTINPPSLTECDQWEPRSSHIIASKSLYHNGVFFRSDDEITVTHTSHAALTLPAGEYRLYLSSMADDAD